MARIAGVDLPAKKRAEIGLTYIYGIGRSRSLSLLHRAGVNADKKVADLRKECGAPEDLFEVNSRLEWIPKAGASQ